MAIKFEFASGFIELCKLSIPDHPEPIRLSGFSRRPFHVLPPPNTKKRGIGFMYTPKQLDEITFGKALFGGYDIASVDQVLEPLTNDYVSLYKENATLKSKMRLLLKKLESRPAVDETAGEKILEDARREAEEIIRNAETQASAIIAAAEAAKPAAASLHLDQIGGIQDQMQQWIQALEQRLNRCGPPVFPGQGWNPCLLHWQVDSLPLSQKGSSQTLI